MPVLTDYPAQSTPVEFTSSGSHSRAVNYRSCVFLPRPLLQLCGQEKNTPVSYYDESLKMQVDFNVADPTSGRVGPAYTTDHLRCLIILLALSSNQGATLTSRSNFASIFRRGVPDTSTKQHVTRLLGDLHATWCRRTMQLQNGSSEELHFKILDAFDIRTRRQGGQILWRQWEALRINPHFHSLADGLARSGKGKSIPVFLPTFLGLTSDLAAKLYLYLAAPAFHHQVESKPFRITTGAIWQRLNLPPCRFASVRKKLLVQNKTSILLQIDQALISRGKHRLRVVLEPTNDRDDYNLLVWAESANVTDQPAARPVSKFKEAWLGSGRTEGEFRQALSPPLEIDEHDRELLGKAGIDPEPCLSALRIAKSLLPTHKWNELIAEAKSDTLESPLRPHAERTRDPVRLLMYRLIEAVSTPSNS